LGDVSAALIAALEALTAINDSDSNTEISANLLVGLEPSAVQNFYAWQQPSLPLVEEPPSPRGENTAR